MSNLNVAILSQEGRPTYQVVHDDKFDKLAIALKQPFNWRVAVAQIKYCDMLLGVATSKERLLLSFEGVSNLHYTFDVGDIRVVTFLSLWQAAGRSVVGLPLSGPEPDDALVNLLCL